MENNGGAAGDKIGSGKHVLVCGASFAGLSTAWWMNRLGYTVVVVELAKGLKKGGTPVDIRDGCVDIAKRMGLLQGIKANTLNKRTMEFRDADDVTVASMSHEERDDPGEGYEIERDLLLDMIFDSIAGDVEFIFDNSVAALDEGDEGVAVTFRDGTRRSFDLVFGCDGIHSAVRRLCFGDEAEFSHFLGQYFSITIVNKLLIAEDTMQLFNAPGKAVMLNAYNGKTDIVLCFSSNDEIPYDYRNEAQQREIVLEQFAGVKWRTPEALDEVKKSRTFYFDKFCQIRMPSWSSGRVTLVGDAGYCASPAAGMGGSLAIVGAAALADAFEHNAGNWELAFQDYNRSLRPFVEEVQENAIRFGLDMLFPETEEAILERNRRLQDEQCQARPSPRR
jgi:2-polyprenyl-6-methoxyphenol hydroxylase-like FAD-dependent oxidoreductase